MRSFYPLLIVIICGVPLLAQTPVTENQLGAYKGTDAGLGASMGYCDTVDNFSQQHSPRAFAETWQDTSGTRIANWVELANNDAWTAAGKPTPLAFVWNRDGMTVKVIIMSRPPRVWNESVGAYRRMEYCYGTDAKLIRIRAAWYAPTQCEFLFPCRLIAGHEFYLGGQHPAITDWIFESDGQVIRLRNGRPTDDPFDPSYSLDSRQRVKVGVFYLRFRRPGERTGRSSNTAN
jgi:hypothetical protein